MRAATSSATPRTSIACPPARRPGARSTTVGEIDVTPPYARIAAELRRRIAEGELAPGDRLPSTRQVAAQWGVALAIATRALAELRREGLVRAEPRIGTVVAEPRPALPTPALPSPALPAARG